MQRQYFIDILKKILRQVVTDKNGTASLADIPGYYVSGKTGTSEYYEDEKKNINTFLGNFSVSGKDYIIMTIFDNPKIPKDLIYDLKKRLTFVEHQSFFS